MSHQASNTTRNVPVTDPDTAHTGTTTSRKCQGTCGEYIPAKRLIAQPNARLCVPCLLAAGDVAPLKRFDEQGPDGEVYETFFTNDRRIERQINHFNKSGVAGQCEFDIVAGDDAHLGREKDEIVDTGRSLASAIISDEDDHGKGYHLNLLTLQHRTFQSEEDFDEGIEYQRAA